MTAAAELLERGRAAFAERAWARAFAHLAAADAESSLPAADLELLAAAAWLSGRDAVSAELWARAHHESARRKDVARAARSAFWLVLALLDRGESVEASGWHARAQGLLDQAGTDCPERGLLLVLASRLHSRRGDPAAATQAAMAAATLAQRFSDPDLQAFGRLVLAQARTRTGDAVSAASLFDELMVAVSAGEVSPIAVGTVYCAVIDACHALTDLERARAWTAALSRWCGSQPDLVPFRGQCLVHRAEVLRLSGEWSEALTEAGRVCSAATEGEPGAARWSAGSAFYQRAEIHRMRGELEEAEEAYRQASHWGHSPEPGLALLRLAQGRTDVAMASVRRLLAEQQTPAARCQALAAAVETYLAARDLPAARAAAAELAAAATNGTLLLRALSAQADGGIRLAEAQPAMALGALRTAWMAWQGLEAPYEAARVRVLLGLACRALQDDEAAVLELDAARQVFERLDAKPDAARVAALLQAQVAPAAAAVTARELQVLRLLAGGKTNRAIAQQLAISERTVDRHVANIFRKLDLSSRSAATAYAYDHGLV